MTIKEDMGKSEDVISNLQSDKIRQSVDNTTRHHVSSFRVIFISLLALLSLSLWLLRLLGIVSLI